MGKVIPFYVPQAILRTRRSTADRPKGKPVGKLIEFPRTDTKKTA